MQPDKIYGFEIGPIRPPSEAYSLLIRATRYCPWNRCRFCSLYKENKFELRPVAEIKEDITAARAIQGQIKEMAEKAGYARDMRKAAIAVLNNPPNEAYANVALWFYAGGEHAFLQDANTLIMRTPELVEVIRFLKETLPTINRVTSYGRSHTAARKKVTELIELKEAGLSRLHIGLESGYDPLLKFMDKGVTAAVHITGGRNIVASGISLSEYVLLGLGGQEMWREHATETARVLNEINPDFIRIRTLSISNRMLLYDDIADGRFTRQTDEQIIEEERLLLENLDCHSNFVSDHIGNLLQEIEGKLPQDKEKLLAITARFQSLPTNDRVNFIVGRRVGIYRSLNDLDDARKHEAVEQVVGKLSQGGDQIDQAAIHTLMERFI